MRTAAPQFSQGFALHQQGKLAEAQRIYEEVLQQQPNHFDALHMLGVIALQTRRKERGIELIRKAIGLNANVAAAHSNLAVGLKELKRLTEALASCEIAISLRPNIPEMHNLRGATLMDLNRTAEALLSFDRAIALKPNYAEAYNNRAVALRNLRRLEDALASCERAIALKPDYAEAYYNHGVALTDLQRPAEALVSCNSAIALKHDYAKAYNNRGVALTNLNRLEEALTSYDRAITQNTNYAEAHSNRGNTLRELNRPEEALASCDRAITLNPDYADPHNNRGVALMDMKRPAEALASYDRAIALKPDYARAHINKSHCLLLIGNFERGWRDYEWRKTGDEPVAVRSYPQPLWLGEEVIAGKTLFIYWEQGLGDTIQFSRYAKLAEARGAKVIMSVQEPLYRLMKGLSATIQILKSDEEPTGFDYHCPLLSLPLAFKTNVSSIPADVPYLKPAFEKTQFWKTTLGPKNTLRVGLVWSGGFRPNLPKLWPVSRRNIPLARFAALKHLNVEFYSLQKGQPAESELTKLTDSDWDGPHIVDFTSQLTDFTDTAALIDNLDLVISVDTSTAHLAGALGKPVWILNRFDTCWRWFLDRTDSPWYPTVKLYRQQNPGDWDDVVRRVKNDLIKYALVETSSRLNFVK
jgi:tetratricopeptide (TPR) repeat protein